MLNKIRLAPTQLLVLGLIFLCVLMFSILPIGTRLIYAQSSNSNFRSLLEELVSEKQEFYISFATPVFGDGVMLSITYDTADPTSTTPQILHAKVQEVGDDFLCVGFYGVNVLDVSCFPFSNIARINYVAP